VASSRPEESEEDEDDDFDEQLRELEELGAHFARRGEPLSRGASSSGVDHRPPTGGSESTTAPASSQATASVEWEDPTTVESFVEEPGDLLRGAQRAHHEIGRMRLPHGCRLEPSQAAFAQLFYTMDVAEGPYTPSTLTFWVKVFEEYPLPGSVSIRCTKRIFHPCIDPRTGATAFPGHDTEVGDASQEIRLASFLVALTQMVKAPCSVANALNNEASALLEADPEEFRRRVRRSLLGDEGFDRVLGSGKASTAPLPSKPIAMSETMRLEMMNIEVLKEDFKATAAAYLETNRAELLQINRP